MFLLFLVLGSKVRKYRNLKGLSQNDLAVQVEVSQSIISSLESDKSIPNSILLNRIAGELDVDINSLLADENIVQNNSDKAVG
ncbi:MAG: helix-turn-helix domain-containing protein, partial [Prevotellaceae bacterium]|nr:helix-turn-helix domain-containing protein [Prevotellaceae bacterium]